MEAGLAPGLRHRPGKFWRHHEGLAIAAPRYRSAGRRRPISYCSSSKGFYIHGKVIEADYGTSHAKVFIGSENFSSTSLNQNRELGLITSSHAVMSAIASTSAAGFQNGEKWS